MNASAGPIGNILAQLRSMRVVDLAPLLERGIPRWPTHPHLTIDKAVTHDHDGYYCQAIMMAEHTGAHVDAPAHMLPNRMDRTIDAADVASTLRRATFGESRGGISILSTVVPATVAYREAATARQPVHRIERQRRGPTASALEVMTALVNELLPHIDLEQAGEPCQAQEELRHA